MQGNRRGQQTRCQRMAARLASQLAAAAVVLLVACGCGTASPHAAGTARRGHVVDLFGKRQPPLLPELTAAQAARLPKLHDISFGPTYQRGRVLGVAVGFAGCERPEGTVVTETETTVHVAVYATQPPEQACISSFIATTYAVWLPQPLGHRTRTTG